MCEKKASLPGQYRDRATLIYDPWCEPRARDNARCPYACITFTADGKSTPAKRKHIWSFLIISSGTCLPDVISQCSLGSTCPETNNIALMHVTLATTQKLQAKDMPVPFLISSPQITRILSYFKSSGRTTILPFQKSYPFVGRSFHSMLFYILHVLSP